MTDVRVELAQAPYDIVIEQGLLDTVGERLAPHAARGRLLLVVDENVAQHWLQGIVARLTDAGIAVESFPVPSGEGSKSWAMLERLVDWLLDHGVERSEAIVALGGGVVGDLTGFAAAVVKRGCGFVQIPTTLLAQVDSSVGGKTAINARAGKNLVGAFHQPVLVLIDPAMLDTLPDRELRAGYAEVVKYGLIDDADFFGWCEDNGAAVLAREPAALDHAIATSVRAKAAIVAADEMERSGTRALLNLGHTFAHALEAETGFSDKLLHGEAVAAGMALAFGYAVRRGECPAEDARRIVAHLRASGLPHDLASAGVSAAGARLVGHMRHDKKMSGGTLPFLLAKGIGQTYLAHDVELSDVAAYLDEIG